MINSQASGDPYLRNYMRLPGGGVYGKIWKQLTGYLTTPSNQVKFFKSSIRRGQSCSCGSLATLCPASAGAFFLCDVGSGVRTEPTNTRKHSVHHSSREVSRQGLKYKNKPSQQHPHLRTPNMYSMLGIGTLSLQLRALTCTQKRGAEEWENRVAVRTGGGSLMGDGWANAYFSCTGSWVNIL